MSPLKLERYHDGQFPVLLLHDWETTPIVVARGELVWDVERRLAKALRCHVVGTYEPKGTA